MNAAGVRVDNRKDIVLLLLYARGPAGSLSEPIAGRTRMMKLVYLVYRELAEKLRAIGSLSAEQRHSFVPYHYGPFSKDVFDDVVFLENANLVCEVASAEELSMAEISEMRLFYDEVLLERIESAEAADDYVEPVFSLTDEGRALAEKLYAQLARDEQKALCDFKAKYAGLPLTALLKYVYTAYPGDATASKIRERF